MTRKEAILRTIDILNSTSISTVEREELIRQLNSCIEELPFAKWTETAIFDACDQFILDNNRNIYTTDFTRSELPNHTVIKNRFKMTAKEFRDKYYPPPFKSASRYLVARDAQQWKGLFIADFHRVKPTASSDYDRNRANGLPTWITVARMLGVSCWTGLIALCGLTSYKTIRKPRVDSRYAVTTISHSEQKLLELEEQSNNS